MGHHQHGPLPGEACQQLEDFAPHRPVEACGGFIQQQHPGVAQQLHRQGQPPLLAAAELFRRLLQRKPPQAHLHQSFFSLLGREPPLAEFELLAHAQPEEVALRELKHQPT